VCVLFLQCFVVCGVVLLCHCVFQGVDLFAKDYILVPVHKGLHWSLLIVCHPAAVVTQVRPNLPRRHPRSCGSCEGYDV
jgi:hypothetical protein